MLARLRPRFTFANVCSLLALLIALGTGSAYAANTVFSTDIVDGEVKQPDLGTASITSPKIRNGEVSNLDLGADAVDGSKVLDASLTAADLGFDSVDSGEIATDAVHGSEVSAGSIDFDELVDGGVTAADIATGAVGNSEIASGAVTNARLGDNSVNSPKVANNTLTAFDIAGGEANGSINLNAGFVANGRCRDFNVAVGGSHVGDAVLFSVNSSVPEGISLSGVRVSSDGNVVAKACNLSGAVFPQLTGIEVAIVTIAI